MHPSARRERHGKMDEPALESEASNAGSKHVRGRRVRAGSALLAAGGCVGLLALMGSTLGWAQQAGRQSPREPVEIAPFRITGVDGYVLTSYVRDDVTARHPASVLEAAGESQQTLARLRMEVFLTMHSYVYHPSLLTLDLGGGPVLDDSSYAVDGTSTSSRKPLYNLSFRANVLRDKPYRGELYFERLNPTQSVGPALVLLTENTRYGGKFAMLPPAATTPLIVEASHSESQGRSSENAIDDRIDQFSMRLDRKVGTLGSTRLTFLSSRQESASGSLGLAIQGSRNQNNDLGADTRLKFGAENEYELTNIASYTTQQYSSNQSTTADRKDLRFNLDLRGRHTEDLQSYARYSFFDSRVNDQATTSNGVGAGATYVATPELSATLGAQGDHSSTGGSTATFLGVNGSANYRRALPLGTAAATYAFSVTQRDQKAAEVSARIVGESITLSGVAAVSLRIPQVITGTVAVSNVTRTQTFVEGIDYSLSVNGFTTRIERVVGGNIVDGQELLIDYLYDLGGTYALSQVDHSLNVSWGFKNYGSIFVQYHDSAPRLGSGAPTFELNPAKTTIYGARADVPLSLFFRDLMIGGRVERESRREAVSPSRRTAVDAYFQTDLPYVRGGNIRLGARRNQVDYDYKPEQRVNLAAWDLSVTTRPWWGTDFSLNATRERDTGTDIPRERTYLTAKAQWAIRRLRLSFDLTRTHEAQGGTERNRTYAQLVLRREF